MTKLSDVLLKSKDPQIQDHIDSVVQLINQGRIGFSFSSTAPTDSPDDYEIRMFKSGSTYRIYVYFVGDGWHYVNLT